MYICIYVCMYMYVYVYVHVHVHVHICTYTYTYTYIYTYTYTMFACRAHRTLMLSRFLEVSEASESRSYDLLVEKECVLAMPESDS